MYLNGRGRSLLVEIDGRIHFMLLDCDEQLFMAYKQKVKRVLKIY